MRDHAVTVTEDFAMSVIRTADHELSQTSGAKFRALTREIKDTIRKRSSRA
jgi:hypothetical protein